MDKSAERQLPAEEINEPLPPELRLTTTGNGKYRQYHCVEQRCDPPNQSSWHIVYGWTRDKEAAELWLLGHSSIEARP